jgi:hypothetical protein
MIKQTWNINEDEKNRILSLHENATKNLYLVNEQSGQQSGAGVTTTSKTSSTEFPKQNVGNQFKFGEYQSDAVKNSIVSLKPKIEEFIKNNGGKQFIVNIGAGESNVTNPKGFETKGSLALARANSVKQYFQETFPNLIKNGTLVVQGPTDVSQVVLGKTPYDKTKGDNKNPQLVKQYRQEQFVNFDIKGSGQVENITSICDWTATITGGTGNPSKNYVTTDIKLRGAGALTFGTGSIPDRLIVVDGKGGITQDTGYVATKAHQYTSFKYVPLYVSRLTRLNNTIPVSGTGLVTIKVKDFNDLMKQILNPGVSIPNDSQLISMGQTEVYNGVEELKSLFNKGIREFVLYTIGASEYISIPFNNKTGDSKVIVYSPVGKTGYSLTGKC